MAVTLLQLRVFYAMKDARTPTLIQVGMVAVRVPLLLLVPVARRARARRRRADARHERHLRRRLGDRRPRAAPPAGRAAHPARRSARSRGSPRCPPWPVASGWLVRNVTDDLLGTSAAGSLAPVLIGTVVIGGAALAGLVVARVPEIREPLAAVRARMGRG